MGLHGLWIKHPRARHPLMDEVDRDFWVPLNAFDIEPGNCATKVMTMLDFNLWAWNIRAGNLTMTNHPTHLHGHEFGGVLPDPARLGAEGAGAMPPAAKPDVEVQARKPGARHGSH